MFPLMTFSGTAGHQPTQKYFHATSLFKNPHGTFLLLFHWTSLCQNPLATFLFWFSFGTSLLQYSPGTPLLRYLVPRPNLILFLVYMHPTSYIRTLLLHSNHQIQGLVIKPCVFITRSCQSSIPSELVDYRDIKVYITPS